MLATQPAFQPALPRSGRAVASLQPAPSVIKLSCIALQAPGAAEIGYAATLTWPSGETLWQDGGALSSTEVDIALLTALLQGIRAASSLSITSLSIVVNNADLLKQMFDEKLPCRSALAELLTAVRAGLHGVRDIMAEARVLSRNGPLGRLARQHCPSLDMHKAPARQRPRSSAGVIDLTEVNHNIKHALGPIIDLCEEPVPHSLYANTSALASQESTQEYVIEPEANTSQAEMDCPICMDTCEAGKALVIAECKHQFCFECLDGHISSKLQDRIFPIPCPGFKCTAHLTVEECATMLQSYSLVPQLLKMEMEAAIPEAIKFYCPHADCSQLMVLDEPAQPDEQADCHSCRKPLCLFCRTPAHAGLTCGENKAGSSHDKDLLKLANTQSWRQCPKCRQMIERTMGCNYVRCRCGAELCYGCGGDYRAQCRCNKYGH